MSSPSSQTPFGEIHHRRRAARMPTRTCRRVERSRRRIAAASPFSTPLPPRASPSGPARRTPRSCTSSPPAPSPPWPMKLPPPPKQGSRPVQLNSSPTPQIRRRRGEPKEGGGARVVFRWMWREQPTRARTGTGDRSLVIGACGEAKENEMAKMGGGRKPQQLRGSSTPRNGWE